MSILHDKRNVSVFLFGMVESTFDPVIGAFAKLNPVYRTAGVGPTLGRAWADLGPTFRRSEDNPICLTKSGFGSHSLN